MKAVLLSALLLAPHAKSSDSQCKTDSDCKLLYDFCSCIAVPAADGRIIWPSGNTAQCKCNACHCNAEKPAHFVKAKCVEGQCQRSDEAKPAGEKKHVDPK